MANKKKIIFIIPWFGPFPKWMSFFLKSCELNPDINFLFYTDTEIPSDLPKNVLMKESSFEAYKKRVSENLKINFNPDSAYKLCDLKPALGDVHMDDIRDYDFWGFCDIDLIFGNIKKFLTESILDKYDIFTTYDRRIAGHFTVMKNTEEWRQKYRKCSNWKNILEDNNHHAFDEKNFSDLFIKNKNWPRALRKAINYFRLPDSRRLYAKDTFNTPYSKYPSRKGNFDFPVDWHWNNGKLTDTEGFEYLYFHFLIWKQSKWKEENTSFKVKDISKSWKITSEGFIGD